MLFAKRSNTLRSKTSAPDQPKAEQTAPVVKSVPDEYVDPVVRSEMASTMMRNLDRINMPMKGTAHDVVQSEISLITPMQPVAEVLNVEKLVWVQVPCAVESGACAKCRTREHIQISRCHYCGFETSII